VLPVRILVYHADAPAIAFHLEFATCVMTASGDSPPRSIRGIMMARFGVSLPGSVGYRRFRHTHAEASGSAQQCHDRHIAAMAPAVDAEPARRQRIPAAPVPAQRHLASYLDITHVPGVQGPRTPGRGWRCPVAPPSTPRSRAGRGYCATAGQHRPHKFDTCICACGPPLRTPQPDGVSRLHLREGLYTTSVKLDITISRSERGKLRGRSQARSASCRAARALLRHCR